ncbi:MAG: 3-dehydroquinate synthase [Defluviitaleaceae bacterium]|nr:3-dehydroquinate synthase [Defluviitaleaceae bacterium]
MITIDVPVSKPYEVVIGTGILSQIGNRLQQLVPQAKKIAIITDDNVKTLYLAVVKQHLLTVGLEVVDLSIRPGEASKNSDTYIKLQNGLAEAALTGTDAIVALGGGVVGDLAGFVAATYLRGISYVQIPTSLLAMVDSSVGGKTAIDLPVGKNLVGAFYQPVLVLCDTALLETLPVDILNDGYSEIIKYGMLGHPELLKTLAKDQLDLNEVVATCVKMKSDIVCADEFDKGIRKLLNFGHTIGHAIEQVSGYTVSHGKAVAIGMVMDTRAAVALGYCPLECLALLRRLLEKYNLPSSTTYSAEAIYEGATRDKKREGDQLTNVVPCAVGKCELTTISMAEFYHWIKKGVNV